MTDQRINTSRRLALTVACPRCKVPTATACIWGVTHSGGEVPQSHVPRYKLAKRINLNRTES